MNSQFPANIERLSLENLYLDPNNFRLIHEKEQKDMPDDMVTDKNVAQRTTRLLCGEKNQHIQDLIDSFRKNGYLPVDQIQIRSLPDGLNYVVVEGNRRVAALKFLKKEYDTKHIDLGKLEPELFDAVPVVLYANSDEAHHLVLMALKHISGNRKWGEWNQAKLLETLKQKHKLSEEDICGVVGISKVELRRTLRALGLVEQYLESEYGDQFEEPQFPMFREVVRSGDLKSWLGWNDELYRATNVQNAELFFSWLSREPVENDEDDGFNSEFFEPILLRRDDIRLLNEIINDTAAMAYVIKNRDLNGAHRASSLVFQGRKSVALQSLTEDVGTLQQLNIDKNQIPVLEQSLNKLQGIIARVRATNISTVEHNSAFHDRVDEHLTHFTINLYKKLSGLSISKLSRVNLFAGINNTGKTSLLEAIYLLVRQNDVDGILEIIRRRGKVSLEHVQPLWLAGQLPEKAIIEGRFDTRSAKVTLLTFDELNSNLDRSRYLKTIEINTEFGNVTQRSSTHLFQDRERETLARSIRLLCPIVYSSPFFLNESQHHTHFYYRSMQSKALPKIFEFLKKNVLPGISDIRLVDDLQRFLVDDEAFDLAVDLSNYGEGLQRIFFISLTFAAAQNGIVLIDEFENAIHADLLQAFAKHIVDLADLFNVQVFLTSHSKEAIDAFTFESSVLSNCSFHALINKSGKIDAHNFTGDEFRELLDLGDVDLRRAR